MFAFIRNKISIIAAFFLVSISAFSQPTISSFAPESGPVGTSVIIMGSNFDPVLDNNIVFFGATQANVLAATASQLTVEATIGSTFQPITVLVGGLVAYSSKPFIITFEDPGLSEKSFAPYIDFQAGSFPNSTVVADLDLDGFPDLVTANKSGSSISVFKNITSANESINFLQKVDLSTNIEPNSVSATDLDGDGKLDIIVINNESISIFKNVSTVGSINFDQRVDINTGATSNSITIGDFDSDGKSDFAILNRLGDKLTVYRNQSNNGNISFSKENEYSTGNGPISISSGDLDGDNRKDLVVTNAGDSSVSVLRNSSPSMGTISFDQKIDFFTGYFPISNALGDLDGDGKMDIAISSRGSKSVKIMKNIGSGIGLINFDPTVNYPVESNGGLTSISIGDLDGDGKLDIVIGELNNAKVTVLKNTGNDVGLIEFNQKVEFDFQNSRTTDVDIADLNGDGQNDLIVTGFVLSIFRNTISETEFKTFSFIENSKNVTIDSNTNTISVELVNNTDITNLIATFSLSAGASATIEGASQKSGTTTNDFSNEVTYKVTAEDGVTSQNWEVIITVVSGLDEKFYNSIIGTVYPNPFTNTLNVPILLKEKNSLVAVKLIDSRGKMVLEDNFTKNNDFEYQLNINNLSEKLSTGIYILKIGVYSKSIAQQFTTSLYYNSK